MAHMARNCGNRLATLHSAAFDQYLSMVDAMQLNCLGRLLSSLVFRSSSIPSSTFNVCLGQRLVFCNPELFSDPIEEKDTFNTWYGEQEQNQTDAYKNPTWRQ